jgi:hypothetical protein
LWFLTSPAGLHQKPAFDCLLLYYIAAKRSSPLKISGKKRNQKESKQINNHFGSGIGIGGWGLWFYF